MYCEVLLCTQKDTVCVKHSTKNVELYLIGMQEALFYIDYIDAINYM